MELVAPLDPPRSRGVSLSRFGATPAVGLPLFVPPDGPWALRVLTTLQYRLRALPSAQRAEELQREVH